MRWRVNEAETQNQILNKCKQMHKRNNSITEEDEKPAPGEMWGGS